MIYRIHNRNTYSLFDIGTCTTYPLNSNFIFLQFDIIMNNLIKLKITSDLTYTGIAYEINTIVHTMKYPQKKQVSIFINRGIVPI